MAKKLTEMEKERNRIKREVDKYMESVYDFLRKNNNGEVPLEYTASLLMLRDYYEQYLVFSAEINKLDSFVVDSRYGPQPCALLTARDKCVGRLTDLLKNVGCVFKEQVKMKLNDNKEVSPLDGYLNSNRIEKR